jgi:ABC-2 type transport system ATP-binding protein
MLGLAQADSGESKVLGMNSRTEGLQIRQRIGYVPEQPTLYDWMTVAEIGWFTAGFYGDGYESRYREYATQFELPLARRLKKLSKGMRAKVALSLAMAHEPQLLVLDEPTSGLDTLVRRDFLESMVDLAASGQTVLLSSHQINEVERVADIVAIVRDGHLLLAEPLDRLKAETRQLTLTLADGTTGPPTFAGQTLHERSHGRQWQLLVRTTGDGQIDHLQDDPTVSNVDVHAPSLEEIFVAYMQSDSLPSHPGPSRPTAAEEATPR